MKYDKDVYDVDRQKFKDFLQELNKYLRDNTFLVGFTPTIADIVLANFLVPFYRFLLTEP